LGTRAALSEMGRFSITITLKFLSPQTFGALIVLYERAVGFYASFLGINAYHQPGVEAGKKAATHMLNLKKQILALLKSVPDQKLTPISIAEALQIDEPLENIFKLLEYLSPNGHLVRHTEIPLAANYYQFKLK
jgi:glucose-6-phosphate isomerase